MMSSLLHFLILPHACANAVGPLLCAHEDIGTQMCKSGACEISGMLCVPVARAGGAEGSDDVPRWQLRCTRDSLNGFVGAITHALRRSLVLPHGDAGEAGEGEGQREAWLEAEALRVAYELDTWQLLQVGREGGRGIWLAPQHATNASPGKMCVCV